MEKVFLDAMREELLRQRQGILNHLDSEAEGVRELLEDEDPKDAIDLAAEDVNKQNLEALSVVESRRLQLIENALARLQNGHYGVCMECSQKIPRARLEAIPYALFCVSCQSKRDRANR